MLSKNNSYFDRELCLDGHYIITGYTNDQFCGDTLELSDIRLALHRYLRYEQDFQAVFFLDTEEMLFCLDEQSFDIMTTGQIAAGAGTSAGRLLSSPGPFRRRRRRKQEGQNVETQAAASSGRPLHRGRMSLDAAWQQVAALMKRTDYRCALVISNADMMRGGEKTLSELASFHSVNHSIVIYIFRETLLADAERWTGYAQNILLPRITSSDPVENRVISLRTPNSKEICNLLNRMRFGENPEHIAVREGDIIPLGEILAASCSRKKRGLSHLYNRLIRHTQDHPGATLSTDTWKEFTEERDYRSPLEELNDMVGLERADGTGVKEQIRGWYARQQRENGLRTVPVSSSRFAPLPMAGRRLGNMLNVVLKGSSGTGKSTIARLMGRLYYDLGLLPQGQLVECSAADLISPYVGGSPDRVRQRVQEAMGGVLFIDEAYALAGDDHGLEVINQLVNDMSRYEGQLAVIMAGYPRQMDELLRINEGFSSRFPTTYVLDDYTPNQLQQIFRKIAAADQVTFSAGLEERMDDFFEAWVSSKTQGWSNAREARNLLEEMKKRCSIREIAEDIQTPGMCLTEADVPERLRPCLAPRSKNLDEAFQEIDRMIGLGNIKLFLRELCQRILLGAEEKAPGNFIFSGPPGTGKTTVARRMGEILGLLGVLGRKTNNLTECRAADLLNGTIQLRDAVDNARRGVFFLDEAHQLANSPEGRAIIRELVPLIEDPEIHADTCFICAGYAVGMRDFLAVDEGLSRRFPENHRIHFNDYTAEELVQILAEMAAASGQTAAEGYLTRSQAALERYMERRPPNFGNGGFIRDTYLPDSITARTRRLNLLATGSSEKMLTQEQAQSMSYEDKHTLTELDIPAAFVVYAGPVGRKPRSSRDRETLLGELIGKEKIAAFARSRQDGQEQVFFDGPVNTGLHYAIAGPAGSGRHTAIRTLAAVWKEDGLLERDDVLCVGKGDLEAGYVGQTAGKTQNVIERAVGGTLVIEYPSSLLPKSGTDNSFGPEALGVILSALADHQADLSIVFLDSREGLDTLFRSMPALRSRLVKEFTLDDLTPEQMRELFERKTRDGMTLDESVRELLPDFFLNWVSDRGGLGNAVRSWGNGLEVERLAEELVQNWKGGETREEDGVTRRLITADCFPAKLRRYLRRTSVVSKSAMQELDRLPGLQSTKDSIRSIERRIRRLGQGRIKPGCYLYTGNPGVGKTTVARLMGGVLRASGVLKQGHVIERTARQLCEQPGEFENVVKLARNGILFIDEAHQLAESGYGRDVVKRLLTTLEDDAVTDTTCIILAG